RPGRSSRSCVRPPWHGHDPRSPPPVQCPCPNGQVSAPPCRAILARTGNFPGDDAMPVEERARAPAASVDALIGDTPLVRLSSICDSARGIDVYGKLESLNPGASVKDRSARQMIEQARRDHRLAEGWTVVESTSGNMGHALAMLCAVHKYRFVCVLDPKTP